MSRKSYGSAIGFLDLLFNCLIVFVFMFVVAFAQIEPVNKDAELKTKAEFVITMTWDKDDSNDIDIWVLDPARNLISFKDKAKGLTHLDRDDLGHAGDKFVTPDGQVIEYDYNQEIVTIRGFIPGEWVINIHLFKKNQTRGPSKVNIRIDKLNPSVITILNENLVITKYWEEKTVIRFRMDNKGNITDRNKMFKSLIKLHPSMHMLRSNDGNTESNYPRGDR
jgi:hypothetical protein